MAIQRNFSVESHASQVVNFVHKVTKFGKREAKCFCRYFVGAEIHGLKQASCVSGFLYCYWCLGMRNLREEIERPLHLPSFEKNVRLTKANYIL